MLLLKNIKKTKDKSIKTKVYYGIDLFTFVFYLQKI